MIDDIDPRDPPKPMTLGTETGSGINHIQSGMMDAKPEVGMGATLFMWSDRHAYTINEVKSAKTIIATRDVATRADTNGQSESQTYKYTSGDYPETFTLRKNGRWCLKGQNQKSSPLKIGARDEYYDYSF